MKSTLRTAKIASVTEACQSATFSDTGASKTDGRTHILNDASCISSAVMAAAEAIFRARVESQPSPSSFRQHIKRESHHLRQTLRTRPPQVNKICSQSSRPSNTNVPRYHVHRPTQQIESGQAAEYRFEISDDGLRPETRISRIRRGIHDCSISIPLSRNDMVGHANRKNTRQSQNCIELQVNASEENDHECYARHSQQGSSEEIARAWKERTDPYKQPDLTKEESFWTNLVQQSSDSDITEFNLITPSYNGTVSHRDSIVQAASTYSRDKLQNYHSICGNEGEESGASDVPSVSSSWYIQEDNDGKMSARIISQETGDRSSTFPLHESISKKNRSRSLTVPCKKCSKSLNVSMKLNMVKSLGRNVTVPVHWLRKVTLAPRKVVPTSTNGKIVISRPQLAEAEKLSVWRDKGPLINLGVFSDGAFM